MLLRLFRRRGKGSRGQTLVEFAFTLPILLFLTVGMIDMARAVYFYNTLSNAAREGARFGIVLTDRLNGNWYDEGNLSCPKTMGVCQTDPATGNPKHFLTVTYNNASAPTVASLKGTNTIVGNALKEVTGADLSKTAVTISVNPASVTPGLSLPLTVTMQTEFKPMVSYVIGTGSFVMKSSSMMRTQASSTYPSTPTP